MKQYKPHLRFYLSHQRIPKRELELLPYYYLKAAAHYTSTGEPDYAVADFLGLRKKNTDSNRCEFCGGDAGSEVSYHNRNCPNA